MLQGVQGDWKSKNSFENTCKIELNLDWRTTSLMQILLKEFYYKGAFKYSLVDS